jgi:SAM-dependent methyltransferase
MFFNRKSTQVSKLEFPPEVDLPLYRSLHNDLARMNDLDLAHHYEDHGSREGSQSNVLRRRHDFIELIPASSKILEIGPFGVPLLRGPTVSYFDVLNKEQLSERARKLGWEHSNCPEIDYVSASGDLRIVTERFDVVLSSHAIEHQPDLIRHLVDVERLLNPGGVYFLIIPDKNYCFDHFIPESTLAGVIDAHVHCQSTHSLRSIIEHRALITHNDPLEHWKGNHGEFMCDIADRVERAVSEYRAAGGAYIDVHAWYFSPSSFRGIISALNQTSYTGLCTERVYNTLYGQFEFWAILRKPL